MEFDPIRIDAASQVRQICPQFRILDSYPDFDQYAKTCLVNLFDFTVAQKPQERSICTSH
jgi:hypothetical protein